MAAQGWVGFNVNYRLSPGATFWTLVDCKRALAWIREHADDYGIDPDFICVPGRSAAGTSHPWARRSATLASSLFEDADIPSRQPCPSTGSTTSPRTVRWIRSRDLPPLPRADRDEGLPGGGAGALRRGVAAAPRARRGAAVLRDPRRPGHAGPGRGRPGVRRADARSRRNRSCTPRCRGRSTRSRCSPAPDRPGDRRRRAVPHHAVAARGPAAAVEAELGFLSD